MIPGAADDTNTKLILQDQISAGLNASKIIKAVFRIIRLKISLHSTKVLSKGKN